MAEWVFSEVCVVVSQALGSSISAHFMLFFFILENHDMTQLLDFESCIH